MRYWKPSSSCLGWLSFIWMPFMESCLSISVLSVKIYRSPMPNSKISLFKQSTRKAPNGKENFPVCGMQVPHRVIRIVRGRKSGPTGVRSLFPFLVLLLPPLASETFTLARDCLCLASPIAFLTLPLARARRSHRTTALRKHSCFRHHSWSKTRRAADTAPRHDGSGKVEGGGKRGERRAWCTRRSAYGWCCLERTSGGTKTLCSRSSEEEQARMWENCR